MIFSFDRLLLFVSRTWPSKTFNWDHQVLSHQLWKSPPEQGHQYCSKSLQLSSLSSCPAHLQNLANISSGRLTLCQHRPSVSNFITLVLCNGWNPYFSFFFFFFNLGLHPHSSILLIPKSEFSASRCNQYRYMSSLGA